MKLDPALLEQWGACVGRTERRTQKLDIESLRRFAVACGLSPDVETTPPALAHWAWFLPTVSDADLGPDGHPKRGNFMPAIALPRRMFAGSTMQFDARLECGVTAVLDTTITKVSHKSGRSGDLVFVEVDRQLSQHGTSRVRERQTIVYREGGAGEHLPVVRDEDSKDDKWTPHPVNLFRFSAVTFNSHRIHYDKDFATAQEGYPALVVHGPFIAIKLAAFAEAFGARMLASFEFKGLAPCFVNQPLRFVAGSEAAEFSALRCDDVTAMSARVSWQ